MASQPSRLQPESVFLVLRETSSVKSTDFHSFSLVSMDIELPLILIPCKFVTCGDVPLCVVLLLF